MRFLYTLLLTLSLPFIFFRLWRRGRKLPAYRLRWQERLGLFETPKQEKNKTIWFHTASVGEFITAKPLINQLLDNKASSESHGYGNVSIVITSTTPTATTQIKNSYGDKVTHVYASIDLPIFINNFLRRVKPDLAIILEREIWPNTIALCDKHKIPTLLLNARLSSKSAKGYQNFSSLSQSTFGKISAAGIQSSEDAERLYKLGLDKNRSAITGNIKFDTIIFEELKRGAQALKNKPCINWKKQILIAASTHEGEDKIILDAFTEIAKVIPDSMLMLAPRHPDRFEDVYRLCLSYNFKVARRTGSEYPAEDDNILLCDTMGELLFLYGCADVAFVGGSFIENGGHNYIEPAAWGIPILSGPSTYNFTQVADLLTECEGLTIVNGAKELAENTIELFNNEEECSRKGSAALKVALSNRGATKATMELIRAWL